MNTALFVCVNGAWRFEGWINGEDFDAIKKQAEADNGPDSVFTVTVPDVPAHQLRVGNRR